MHFCFILFYIGGLFVERAILGGFSSKGLYWRGLFVERAILGGGLFVERVILGVFLSKGFIITQTDKKLNDIFTFSQFELRLSKNTVKQNYMLQSSSQRHVFLKLSFFFSCIKIKT